MYYAIVLGTNPNGMRYMQPIDFMREDESELPICSEDENELRDRLKGHIMYDAGYVDIIELGY